ncbi:MAG TPA: alpha/beta hydrolase family protein [Gemmatimonadaceae bacterium]|nr:alpha/beta hydrolase family protein [Gemmatimonadaceae bacterium]
MRRSQVRLTCAGVLLASALFAAACTPSRFAGGSPPPQDRPVSASHTVPAPGEVRIASFFAPSLGVRKHYVVYLPPSYSQDSTRRYPVAYYLHGADGNESDWVSRAGIDFVMDSLIAAGTPPMILVMPDGDESWYADWATPTSFDDCAAHWRSGEAAALHCVHHEWYDRYLAGDLVRHVDSTYRTLADRRHRAIAGLSMGGYGALAVAFRHPALYGAVVSHSGVVSLLYVGPHPFAQPARYANGLDTLRAALGQRLWSEMVATLGDDVAAWRAHDPTHLVRALLATHQPIPAIYFDAGRDDRLTSDRNRAFDAELTALGVAHEFRQWPGVHSWRYWHEHVGDGLAWLGTQIGR